MKNVRMDIKFSVLAAAILGLLALAGCSKYEPDRKIAQAQLGDDRSDLLQPRFALSVYRSDGSGQKVLPAVYADGSSSGALQLFENEKYIFSLNSEIPGQVFQMTMIADLPAATPSSPIVLSAGDNTITAPSLGDYNVTITSRSEKGALLNKDYGSSVRCRYPSGTPPLTSASLNGASINVSNGSGTNLYNFSAALGNAGGIGPYSCAWDFNGVLSRSSSFRPCTQAVTDVYVNYVENRDVGVIVRDDACNTTVSISRSVNIPLGPLAGLRTHSQVPFIEAHTSNATGELASDPRVNGITYYATNNSRTQPVQTNFTLNGANSVAVIQAYHNFGTSFSANFGMSLTISGLNANFDEGTGTGTVNASNATLTKIAFTTDQAGDSRSQVKLTGFSCTLSNQGAEVRQISGQPCTGGTTEDFQRDWSVEIWGDYRCVGVSAETGSVTFQGRFDGMFHQYDGCIGGGGGGGGGIVPITM